MDILMQDMHVAVLICATLVNILTDIQSTNSPTGRQTASQLS